MLKYQLTSSLEKCFVDSDPMSFAPLKRISVLKDQKLSFQLIYRDFETDVRYFLSAALSGVDAAAVSYRTVEYIPSMMPVYRNLYDENYVNTMPGLYPDLLKPVSVDGVTVFPIATRSLWIELSENALPAGDHKLTLTLTNDTGEAVCEVALEVVVIDAALPEQTLIQTGWFHTDSLMSYYRFEAFSDEYWRVTENFMRSARGMGINLILTPVFTPPLDTKVGGERLTVQLVDVARKNGEYSFAYDKLDRYIKTAQSVGITHFEIAHFFTQWGAKHAPKIMATTENGYERIFGWETDAAGEDYRTFLKAFVPALIAHLTELGVIENTYFHISDEPNETHFDSYRAAREGIVDLLRGHKVIDALTDFEYYKMGLAEHPVPGSHHMAPFIENNVPDLWTYYCCGQAVGTSNRFFGMPSARTRYLGTQLYYFDIKGFLQWGFNFYFSFLSTEPINPFLDSTGNGFCESGDAYIVYPAPDGTAWESIRYISFREGLEDMRAMQLAEKLVGREAVKELLDRVTGGVNSFNECVCESKRMLAIREAVNDLIAKNL